MFKSAKKLQEGDKMKMRNGELVELLQVGRFTYRTTSPHFPMIEVTYLVVRETDTLAFSATFRLNQKVEVL